MNTVGPILRSTTVTQLVERPVPQSSHARAPREQRGGPLVGEAEEPLLPENCLGCSEPDYRVTGRGGKGLVAQNIWGRDKKKGPVKKVAQSFPVDDGDQVMLVTDGGQLIRTPVDQIRIAGRSTGGVWVLRTAEGERVVSVARLVEDAENVIEEGGGAE